jgi:hypothetical protein
MGDFAHARQFHQVAISAAQEGNNQALEAAAWGRISFTWTYSGNAPEALNCIREARRLATRSANTTVRTYLAAVEAEIQAILGDRVSCLQALHAAEEIASTPTKRCTGYALIVPDWQVIKAPVSNDCITMMMHERTHSCKMLKEL